MKYIDLFAGVGGFRYGIEHSQHALIGQESQQKERPQRGKRPTNEQGALLHNRNRSASLRCVYSNEWDKYANSVYKYHYKECDDRDIRTVKTNEIPEHDLLCGGFPCQSFSVAGKRGGFEDTRGTLFFEIARIARDKRPSYLLLENVKGLLSHDQGKTFQTILGVLADLGYRVEWQVLNSKHFGVPQNRERVFIIGHLGGFGGRKVFPITQSSEGHLRYSGGVISAREQWLKDGKTKSRNFSQGQRIYDEKGISQTLAGNAGGQGGKTGLYATRQPLRYLTRNQKKIEGDYAYTVDGSNTSGIKIPKTSKTVRSGGRKSPPGSKQEWDRVGIRRLTPTECERLQGFPDGWTKWGTGKKIKVYFKDAIYRGKDGFPIRGEYDDYLLEEISDTQRYKCLGNAVTTNVITEIGKKIASILPIDIH